MTKKNNRQELLRRIPSIEKLLHEPAIDRLVVCYGRQLITYALRQTVKRLRRRLGVRTGNNMVETAAIAAETGRIALTIATPSLKPVINASGVVLHTNLGRAPMGNAVLEEIAPIVCGYANVEFNLATGARGHRVDHVAEPLRYLTGAEDVVVVNNNAAAVILVLHTLAQGREAVISRGELIEIGGAFRIPDIMAAAGVVMKEVGTTNRTRLADYEKAITENTGVIVKAHKSNYAITGFTEEVTVRDLAALAKRKRIPFVYDIGSGLLRKPRSLALSSEPDVRGALAEGADLVTFSGDKLLGGPQAGVVAGRAKLCEKLCRAPLMRALRVGKLTLAALAAACRQYLDDSTLRLKNPAFFLLERTPEERRVLSEKLCSALASKGVRANIVPSTGQVGGGTLPDLVLESSAVALVPPGSTSKAHSGFAERLYRALLRHERPVLGVLREGVLVFDSCALYDEDVSVIADAVVACMELRAAV